jgi:hypothetical protein
MLPKLYGGGRSLERTALPLHFPANSEFIRESGRLWTLVPDALAAYAADFMALSFYRERSR